MTEKKMTAEEAKRLFEEAFKREQRERQATHDSVMKGFVIPIIEQGLLDDVEPPEKKP